MNKEKFFPNLYSDIPPLDEDFFNHAKLVKRQPGTEQISIRMDTEVLEWFRSQGKGYQTLINDVLRTYVTHRESTFRGWMDGWMDSNHKANSERYLKITQRHTPSAF